MPIIGVTAEMMPRACIAAHRYGAVDVLIKPAEPEILHSFVRRHVRQKGGVPRRVVQA